MAIDAHGAPAVSAGSSRCWKRARRYDGAWHARAPKSSACASRTRPWCAAAAAAVPGFRPTPVYQGTDGALDGIPAEGARPCGAAVGAFAAMPSAAAANACKRRRPTPSMGGPEPSPSLPSALGPSWRPLETRPARRLGPLATPWCIRGCGRPVSLCRSPPRLGGSSPR